MIDIEKIKSLEKCKKFTFVDQTDFIDLFKNKNFEVVEVYYPVEVYCSFKHDGELNITFVGKFKWENNIISSLDGDEYNDHMNVIAYEVFSHEDKIYLGVISSFPWR